MWTSFRTFHTPLFICLNSVNLIKLKIETIPNWGISYYFIPNALNAASTGVEYTSKLN